MKFERSYYHGIILTLPVRGLKRTEYIMTLYYYGSAVLNQPQSSSSLTGVMYAPFRCVRRRACSSFPNFHIVLNNVLKQITQNVHACIVDDDSCVNNSSIDPPFSELPEKRSITYDNDITVEIRFEHKNWLSNVIVLCLRVVNLGQANFCDAALKLDTLPMVGGRVRSSGVRDPRTPTQSPPHLYIPKYMRNIHASTLLMFNAKMPSILFKYLLSFLGCAEVSLPSNNNQ